LDGLGSPLRTNVLVYAVDVADERRRGIAREVLARRADRGLVVSTQVLSEFLVAVRRLAVPVAPERARALVAGLVRGVEVHVPSVADILAAAELAARDGIHHYDAMVVQAALSSGCDVLLTEDLQHGRDFGGVVVTDPFR
jgi:predicted nucleic acid-binding protein